MSLVPQMNLNGLKKKYFNKELNNQFIELDCQYNYNLSCTFVDNEKKSFNNSRTSYISRA